MINGAIVPRLLDELIRASTAPTEVENDVGHLVEGEVSEESLINKFGFKTLPQLIVL